MTLEINFELKRERWIEFQRQCFQKTTTIKLPIIYLFLFAGLIISGLILWSSIADYNRSQAINPLLNFSDYYQQNSLDIWMSIGFLFAIFCFLFSILFVAYYSRIRFIKNVHNFTKNPDNDWYFSQHHLRLNENGAEFNTPNTSFYCKWSTVCKILETDEFIAIFNMSTHCQLIDKTMIPISQLEDLQTFLKNNYATKYLNK